MVQAAATTRLVEHRRVPLCLQDAQLVESWGSEEIDVVDVAGYLRTGKGTKAV